MWRSLKKWFLGWIRLKPHFIVGGSKNPYLLRWYIIPRNRFFNIYLHKFLRNDDDRALHDHPWHSLSLCLKGSYVDVTHTDKTTHRIGALVYRKATHAHRIELIDGKPAWTLFITGPIVRQWGFHCPQGWRHWKEFTSPNTPGNIGKGCE